MHPLRSFSLLLTFACHLPLAFCQLNFVNPFIGTGGHGHTYPGATAPFGLVQLSPDTRLDLNDWDGCSGYHYSDSLIYGFSPYPPERHGSSRLLRRAVHAVHRWRPAGKRMSMPRRFQKKNGTRRGRVTTRYCSINDQIRCELTATERVGVHRYTFPPNHEPGSLVIDLRHRDRY